MSPNRDFHLHLELSLMTMDCQVDKDDHFLRPLLFTINEGPTTRELAQHRWVTLLIPLPVTFTQCVRCKTVCLGAKRI
ncbi:putative ankyrin repeat domain-containing protein [Trichinella pseudospiralis]